MIVYFLVSFWDGEAIPSPLCVEHRHWPRLLLRLQFVQSCCHCDFSILPVGKAEDCRWLSCPLSEGRQALFAACWVQGSHKDYRLSVLSRQPVQVSFKTLISKSLLSYWVRMYTGLHPFSNTKINVKSPLSKTCWAINRINQRRIVPRNFLQSCSFVRDNKPTYFAGIGTPLASKSFRNTQPQLNSPLSPVDCEIKEAQRMVSEITTHKQLAFTLRTKLSLKEKKL